MGISNILVHILPGLRKREAKRKQLADENRVLLSRLRDLENRHAELLQKLFYGKIGLEQDTLELYKLFEDGTLNAMQDPIKGLVHLYTHMICSNLGFENPIPPEFDA